MYILSRGPISIFAPIFKVNDRFEDLDLRVAERSYWLEERGSKEEVPGGSSSIFPAEKMEDGGSSFFVPRRWKIEGFLR